MADSTLDITLKNDDEDSDIGSCFMDGGGLDTKRTFSELDGEYYNDEGPPQNDDEDGDQDLHQGGGKGYDHVFAGIKDTVARKQSDAKSMSSNKSDSSDFMPHVKISDQYLSVPYGVQAKATYEHGKRSTDIMGVTYNGRMRQFIILDSKGITTWKRDNVKNRVSRAMSYPKYEYGLITYMVYAKKYNCYFVLGKDFSLKVYNRDFFETCSVSADLRSVLFMLFNPVRDELITGGVGGTKVWRFHQQPGKGIAELRPLANYGLTLKYELPNVGGSWVKRVELDHHLEHLYCCSDTDLHVYNLTGKLLFKYERAHMMSITGCRYSKSASVLVTSSIDCEVKVWSLMGGLVHTFRGHSRAVTNLILHPATSSIVITCSLDGSIRMWSLETMDTLYSLVVSADGVLWMGLTDDNMLFLSTPRVLTLWNLNYSVEFWAMARSRVTKMVLAGCKEKTTRVMAISEDSSVRVIARSNSKNLSTVLPPPSISPLHRVMSVCYSREFNVIFMLINPHEIWLYTTRTDPSCRIAAWNVLDIQDSFIEARQTTSEEAPSASWNKPAPTHRATEKGQGNEVLSNCCCITVLNSTAIVWTDEGCCCPIRDSYLLLGLEDGRILFMDPVKKGHKYLEFKTGKDPVLDMYHDTQNKGLVTLYKLKDRMMLHIWGLPDLELQHEVYLSLDLRDYARLDYTLVTGYEDGCVLFTTLELATDPGLHKAKMLPPYEEVVEAHHKPDHLAPIINVDSCASVKIFATCSKDGAIKIWTEDHVLLTEIMLDDSLSSACFLNNVGDMIVGFQKHVFYIDHTRVCPQLTVPESDIEGFEKESYICEDPYVMYEGVTPNPDPVTLENYLVPFDIEFSKDFLEGKVTLEPEPVKQEESDSESQMSMAPTEIYNSPDSTPRRRLSLVDLTLGSGVSKSDLLNHMKKTMDHLKDKAQRDVSQTAFEEKLANEQPRAAAKRDASQMAFEESLANELPRAAAYKRKKRRQMRKQGIEDLDFGTMEKDGLEQADLEGMDGMEFSFPKFGVSPGATPVSTPPTSPELSSAEEDIEGDVTQETTDFPPVSVEIKVKEEEDDISKFLKAEKDKELMGDSKSPRESKVRRTKFGLSNITVDADSLIKDGKKAQRAARRAGGETASVPTHGVAESDSDTVEKKTVRKEKPAKKKMLSTSQRKPLTKQRKQDADMSRHHDPPSMMQALEIKEQKLAVNEEESSRNKQKKSESHPEDKNLADVSAKIDEKFKDSDQQQLSKDSVEKDFSKQDEHEAEGSLYTVPDLPAVPALPTVPASEEYPHHPTASESKAALLKKLGSKKAMEFHPMPKKTPGSSDLDSGQGGQGETTDPSQQPGRSSVASVRSDEARAAFRIGLLSKEPIEQGTASPPPQLGREASLRSPSVSEMTPATPMDGTTPTPIATPDIGSAPSRPASQAMSLEPQGSTLGRQVIPELAEGLGDRSDAMSSRNDGLDVDMESSEISVHRTGSPDSGLVDSDFISVSRQGLRSAERHLREEAELIGAGYRSEDGGFEDKSGVGGRSATTMAYMENAFADQPELLNALRYFRSRPNTGHRRFNTEDLQVCFETSLQNYKRLARTAMTSDKLYKNEDLDFAEEWHERQIERHMLVRMQKELRAQNAQKRRQLMDLKKFEKYKQRFAEQSYGERPSTVAVQVTMETRRANTVHGSRPTQPAPTPVSSRPHTAIGAANTHHRGPSMALSLHGQLAMTLEQRAHQKETEAALKGKAQLGSQKPFRFRLRQAEDHHPEMMDHMSHKNGSAPTSPRIDPWMMDPRNPKAVRPKSSKSIPSKCHRYVLVSKPKAKMAHPLPTPLEEQLLAMRFPEQGERVSQRFEGMLYRPPQRPVYGINYSPFQHQLYG